MPFAPNTSLFRKFPTLCVFVLFSLFCFGAGVWRHLYPGPPPPVPDAARIHPAILVLVNGILGMVSIAALIAIWLDPG